jgi:hypothetical protein
MNTRCAEEHLIPSAALNGKRWEEFSGGSPTLCSTYEARGRWDGNAKEGLREPEWSPMTWTNKILHQEGWLRGPVVTSFRCDRRTMPVALAAKRGGLLPTSGSPADKLEIA